MTDNSHLNESRFQLIFESLQSCDRISSQLDSLDQLSVSVNDDNLSSLIELTNRINAELQSSNLRGREYHRLLEHCPLIESIVHLVPRLSKCVADRSKYDEAIKLIEQVTNLHKTYGAQVPIIKHIYLRSEEQRSKLVSNLHECLDRLQECNVDEVSKIVHQIFRCEDLSDRDLKLKYLQARDNWFNNACEDSSASFDDVVRIHCNGLPMIYKEYKSIFGDPNVLYDSKRIRIMNRDPMRDDGAIINSWLLMKTSIFISSLKVYLKTIHLSGTQTPTMLGDTIQRCFELADWLASIGFDFSTQLRPIFLKNISSEVRTSIERATERFETTFTVTVSKSIESLLLPIEDEILRISNMRPEERLPESIEHYPVFKIYCLHILDSLRWLHISKGALSPISLCLDTYEALNTSLTRVTKALVTILNIDNNSRHPILTKITVSYITEVLPFFTKYCDTLFHERAILNTVGLSKSDFKSISASEPARVKNFRLDHKQIAEPLRSIMPALVQTVE